MTRQYRHPNADGRLFRLLMLPHRPQWQVEIGRVPNCGNVFDIDDDHDRDEAEQFTESCEELARAWMEDQRPEWLLLRLCQVLQHDPCLDGTAQDGTMTGCQQSQRPLDEWCLSCAARAWLAEFYPPPRDDGR